MVAGLATAVSAQHTLAEVAAGLRAADVSTRLRAIEILREAGRPDAAGPLAVAINDADDRVKLAAIDAERSFFVARPVAPRKKVGGVFEVRETATMTPESLAVEKLSRQPLSVPVPVLTELTRAMRATTDRVRVEAIEAFGRLAPLGGPTAEDAVHAGVAWSIELMKNGHDDEQVAAAGAIARALDACGAMVRSGDGSVSQCAEAGNVLVAAMNGTNEQIRRTSMIAVGELRYPDAVEALTERFNVFKTGTDARIALTGLAIIGHESSVDTLRRQATNRDPEIRRLAVEGIAQARAKSEWSHIATLGQTERTASVLLAMQYASVKLGVTSRIDQLTSALRQTQLRPYALRYLLDLAPTIVPGLTAALRSNDPDTRTYMAAVLGYSGNREALPALEAATKDRDPEAARSAQRAIDRLKLER